MIKTPVYLIITCGYEGIDGLNYVTDDPDEASKKVIELRENVDEYTEPDQICVHSWNPVDELFECCCRELKVPASKTWWMA
jgi:hypothetical protein